MRLKAAADFAAQQAGLATRNVDSATLAAFESQRKKMNQRFNELVRLIDQVDRNQKTELLSEKLDALILFLDPDITAPNSSETVKQPEKLSRGAAPVRQKKTIQ